MGINVTLPSTSRRTVPIPCAQHAKLAPPESESCAARACGAVYGEDIDWYVVRLFTLDRSRDAAPSLRWSSTSGGWFGGAGRVLHTWHVLLELPSFWWWSSVWVLLLRRDSITACATRVTSNESSNVVPATRGASPAYRHLSAPVEHAGLCPGGLKHVSETPLSTPQGPF